MVTLRHRRRGVVAFVHRLVLAAFVGPRPRGRVANHKNGAKGDNCVPNLEWVTPRENQDHAMRIGLCPRGEANGRAKLTEDNVREIRVRYALGNVSQTVLAREFGVTQGLIGHVVRRRNWTHLK